MRDIQDLKTKLDQTIQEKDRLKQEFTRQEDASKELKKSLDSRNKSIDELTAKMAIRDIPFDGKGAFVSYVGAGLKDDSAKIKNIKFWGNQFFANLSFDYEFGHTSPLYRVKIPFIKNFPCTERIYKLNETVRIEKDDLIFETKMRIGSVQVLFHI